MYIVYVWPDSQIIFRETRNPGFIVKYSTSLVLFKIISKLLRRRKRSKVMRLCKTKSISSYNHHFTSGMLFSFMLIDTLLWIALQIDSSPWGISTPHCYVVGVWTCLGTIIIPWFWQKLLRGSYHAYYISEWLSVSWTNIRFTGIQER